MNYRSLAIISVIYSAVSCINARTNLAGRTRSTPDWEDALNDFKLVIRAVSFGEPIPVHQTNPLQMMAFRPRNEEMFKNPFDLPENWFGKKKKSSGKGRKLRRHSKSRKSRKNRSSRPSIQMNKLESLRAAPIRDHQNLEDLALLNFLVQQEEPSFRIAAAGPAVETNNEKTLASLLMAEERYNEIIAQQNKSKKLRTMRSKLNGIASFKNSNGGFKTGSKPTFKQSKESKDKKTRFDGQSIKKTLTLSVAFGVIVTALFCVVVQLFKLFAGSKGSRNGGNAFDQINRRSNYGYDRIALDVEEEDENSQLI